ncbi:MAG TPA: hypothetical protein VNY05_16705 [Candidatus Acidoferrales bacterium]|jgi:hypothetical protein|nr:hypothetical protein [Candidatus Acidoferrales bacterium]
MGISARVFSIFTLVISSGQAGQKQSITVLVYNYANVSAENLATAEVGASRSYRAAGIEVSWVECAISERDSQRFRECEQAFDKPRLWLSIIPNGMAARIPRPSTGSEDALGIALVSHAFVFYERIIDRARVWGIADSVILGHTMAHELGHLLLGEHSHSATGVMRPVVHQQDLKLESGQFLFDPKQVTKLRAVLQGR